MSPPVIEEALQAAVAAAWQVDCYKVMLMTGSKQPSTWRSVLAK